MIKFGNNIRAKIYDLDIFSRNVTFTHNGKDSFGSILGGLASLCIIVFMIIYSWFGLTYLLWNDQSSSFTTVNHLKNDINDTRIHKMTDSGFRLAFAWTIDHKTSVPSNVSKVSAVLLNTEATKGEGLKFTGIDLAIEPWPEREYPSFNQINELSSYKDVKMMCIKDDNYYLSGSGLSNGTQYLVISIDYWRDYPCVDREVAANLLQRSLFTIYAEQQFFDQDNIDNPIRTHIQNIARFTPMTDLYTDIQIKVRENKYKTQDNSLGGKGKQGYFYNVAEVRENYRKGYFYATVEVKIDSQVDVYERKSAPFSYYENSSYINTYKVFYVIGNIGGVFIVIYGVFNVIFRILYRLLLDKEFMDLSHASSQRDKQPPQSRQNARQLYKSVENDSINNDWEELPNRDSHDSRNSQQNRRKDPIPNKESKTKCNGYFALMWNHKKSEKV